MAGEEYRETEREKAPPIRSGGAPIAAIRTVETARKALAQAERVAVITKFRFMGDTIVATPFLEQLRRHYPNAHISLLTAPSVVTALANCPYVDRLIPIEMRRNGRWRHSRELYEALRRERYGAAFLLNRSLHCAVICAFAGIPVRIGYINELRRRLLTVPIPYYFDRNEVDSHLDMLRALGLPAEDALPDLWITPEERERAQALLRERGWAGAASGRPLIGVQPGANDPPIREWGADRYARVADTLVEETGGSVVLMGGAAEQDTARKMAGAMLNGAIDLVGALDLRDALAVIGQCDLWLGNDTGLLHAAVAQRVASVGLFGPNKVVRWGYEAPRHRSLVVFPEQPARDDASVRRCLDAISEERVLETARAVLAQPKDAGERPVYPQTPSAAPAGQPPYFAATLSPEMLTPARRR
jgi:heptosyltransferase-2